MNKRQLPIVLLILTIAGLLGSLALLSDRQVEFPTAINYPVPDDEPAPAPVARAEPTDAVDSRRTSPDGYDMEVRDPVSLAEAVPADKLERESMGHPLDRTRTVDSV